VTILDHSGNAVGREHAVVVSTPHTEPTQSHPTVPMVGDDFRQPTAPIDKKPSTSSSAAQIVGNKKVKNRLKSGDLVPNWEHYSMYSFEKDDVNSLQ